jgi:SAM-dependent methyltransferase
LVDPVTAYDGIASGFSRISEARKPYLEQVENCIIREAPKGASSMLDVGSGDGRRATRIATACAIQRLVLAEPSAAMRGLAVSAGAETWDIRAEDLGKVEDQFDIITCLWNVLGHIDSSARRAGVLGHFARLLRPGGMLFIDFNHRYNASEYGVAPTLLRFMKDTLKPDERNGDVTAKWLIDGAAWATKGHVFTDGEVRKLIHGAGLKIRRRVVIDYSTGRIRQRTYEGNLLYSVVKEDMDSRRP